MGPWVVIYRASLLQMKYILTRLYVLD
jgi:hypothetical protein